MTIEVQVPSVGESISEATVGAILVQPGAYVREDQEIMELETDKANVTINASCAGKIEILVKEGEDVKVGQLVARIDASAEAPPETLIREEKKSVSADAGASPVSSNVTPAAIEPSLPVKAESAKSTPPSQEAYASPSASALMRHHGLPPSAVPGSGVGGRVTKEDVLSALLHQAIPPNVLPPVMDMGHGDPLPKPIAIDGVIRKKMTRLRRTIAERLLQTKQETAMLTTFNEIDMSPSMTLRNQYKELFEKKHQVRLGFMSFFIKASVEALKAYPEINATIDGDDMVYNQTANISVAVSTPKGLVVPVLKHCENKSFSDVEKELRDLALRGRDGKITLSELQGGGFTITNGGVFGSMLSTPLLNAGQSGILGMHKIEKRPVVINDQIVIRPMMYVALSYDHRIVDGQQAVGFLVKVKELLEDPARILLEV